MSQTDPVRYVLMVVIDPQREYAIGITKKKGPKELIGRLCFPGGKIEPGEEPAMAASRELLEETGVTVKPGDWHDLGVRVTKNGVLHVFCAMSDRVLHARTCEEEPVHHLAIARHLEYATRQPAQYAPDFLQDLNTARLCSLVSEPA